MVTVGAATAKDREAAARVLARAFRDDPVVSWVMPDAEGRELALVASFGAGFDQALGGGEVRVARVHEDLEGAAIWYPPGLGPGSGTGTSPGDDSAPPADAAPSRGAILSAAMAEHHPGERHYYLRAVGVPPHLHGRGIGSALIAPVTGLCDRFATGAYLEATTEDSLRLYERHGFVVTGVIELPAGPRLYPMWREPQS